MKWFVFIIVFVVLIDSKAQNLDKWYVTSGGEFILSSADISINGVDVDAVTRLSVFFHLQSNINFDFAKNIGVFSGFAVRNIGFIYDDPLNPGIRKKHRTYNVGFPIGLKLGNLDRRFIFMGYELELPTFYKEKTFENDRKIDKFSVGFRNSRTPAIYHTAFVGFNAASGMSVKFKYYFTKFFDNNYTEFINGVGTQPFSNFDVNIFYVSLSFALLKNTSFYDY